MVRRGHLIVLSKRRFKETVAVKCQSYLTGEGNLGEMLVSVQYEKLNLLLKYYISETKK